MPQKSTVTTKDPNDSRVDEISNIKLKRIMIKWSMKWKRISMKSKRIK
jgi:hypothetical protein